VLRSVEEEGIRHRTAELTLTLPSSVAMYILNQKRARLNEIESRYGFTVHVVIDDVLIPPAFKLERTRTRELPPPGAERHAPIMAGAGAAAPESPTPAEIEQAVDEVTEPRDVEEEATAEGAEPTRAEGASDDELGGRRRRRRGRRGGRDDRGERDERSERGERSARGERGERSEGRDERSRGERPRRDYPRDDAYPLTPAAVGAMLDGRPVSSFEDEERESIGNEGASAPTHAEDDGHAEHGEELGPDGQPRRRRRRGRRGGRRRRRQGWEEGQSPENQATGEGDQPDVQDHQDHGIGHESPDTVGHAAADEAVRPRASSHAPEAIERRAEETRPVTERQETPPSPAAEPQGSSASEADPNQPRRKGWWQRFTS
jgi:ribonuclease E